MGAQVLAWAAAWWVGSGVMAPVVKLAVSPHVAIAPLRITAQAIVLDPTGRLACPGYGWDWGDGSLETGEFDCDGLGRAIERVERYVAIAQHTYHTPGRYRLRFVVADSETKRAAVDEVMVAGSVAR